MKTRVLLTLLPLTLVISWSLTAQISAKKSNLETSLNTNQVHTASKTTQTISSKPSIQHGINYQTVADIRLYYVSEKLDGIRGYWDGKNLITRQGNLINSPTWFTSDWPKLPIDGELWIERNTFQTLMSCVRRDQPNENKTVSCWKDVKFMMFDLPSYGGDFSQRVKKMQTLLTEIPSPYLAMIKQVRLNNISELDIKLEAVLAAKGEGLMLHLANAHYQAGRTTALMKLKKHQDAEATVIAHTPGKGKYKNMLGALEVQTAEGIIFKIGSGFSDDERANPPAIGTTITFKYNGLTDAGIPRFARFWRIRTTD